MPVGRLTAEEYAREMGIKPDARPNTQDTVEIKESHPTPQGRHSGDNNVPDSLRKIIGEESLMNGRAAAVDLAAGFGLSPSSVSAYAKGTTSTATYNTPSKSIIEHLTKSRQKAMRRATKTLNQALGAMTQEKLDYSDAVDLASIARNMSVVIKNLDPKPEPDVEQVVQNGPKFVIFAPQFRAESQFEVIDVKE